MRYNRIAMIVLLFSALLLSSCSSTTSVTTEDASQSSGASLTPIAEAIEEAENFSPGEYNNLSFAQDTLSITVPENLSCCVLQEVGSFDLEYGDELLHMWISDEIWDDQYYIAWDDTYDYAFSSVFSRSLEDGEEWYAAVWCTGVPFYYRGVGYEHFCSSTVPAYDSLMNGMSAPEQEIELKDGSLKLGDAVTMAETFADNWLAQTELQVTWEPKTVMTIKDENGDKFIRVDFQTWYNGVPISNVMDSNMAETKDSIQIPEEDNGYTGDVELLSVEAYISTVDGLECFGSGHGSVELYDAGTACTAIISLSDACDLLSETLADYSSVEIEAVQLEYRLFVTGADQPEDTYRYVDSETGELLPDRGVAQLYRTSYDLYDATPNWAFYVKSGPGREKVFYVNCLTGDVRVINNYD